MGKEGRATRAKDVDGYLASVPEPARGALERLRRTIKAVAPEASEGISYRVPVYKYLGMLVGFAAFKDHCDFFVMSPAVMEAHKGELKAYDTAKGTVRFPADRPPPTALVRKLVGARMRENEERARARKEKRRRR